jgi:hypothetical protein
MIPLVVGSLLALAVAILGKVTRFDRDRSFYTAVLLIIASYYVLFAIQGDSLQALPWEGLVAIAFAIVAVFGALRLPLLVGVGILAHGLFDLAHPALIHNPGVPPWWPSFCMSFDVFLGLWVIGMTLSHRTRPQRASS